VATRCHIEQSSIDKCPYMVIISILLPLANLKRLPSRLHAGDKWRAGHQGGARWWAGESMPESVHAISTLS